jgi:uncharacterized protein YjiS (DUF1127 family)
VDWAVYAALFVGVAAVVGATILLVVRVLDAWRTLKRFRRHLARALGDLADNADRTSHIVERVADTSGLETSLAQLRRTLRRFAVLRAAADEVSASLTRLTAVYPRK